MSKENLKEIMVLGPPRSGTSVLGGILQILGVDMGGIRKQDHHNPRGYFEDQRLLEISDQMLEETDSKSNGFHPPDRTTLLEMKPCTEQIRQWMTRRRAQSCGDCIGWKAPPMSLCPELFLEHMNHPHFIVSYRNMKDVAESIERYTDQKTMYEPKSFLEAMSLTLRYYQGIHQFERKHGNLSLLRISYEHLLDDPVGGIKKIAKFLRVDAGEQAYQDVRKFVMNKRERERFREKKNFYKKLQFVYKKFKRALLYPHKVPTFICQFGLRTVKKLLSQNQKDHDH